MESPDLCKYKSVTYKSLRSSYEVGWPCIDTAFNVLEPGKCLPLELQQIFIPEPELLSVGAVEGILVNGFDSLGIDDLRKSHRPSLSLKNRAEQG